MKSNVLWAFGVMLFLFGCQKDNEITPGNSSPALLEASAKDLSPLTRYSTLPIENQSTTRTESGKSSLAGIFEYLIDNGTITSDFIFDTGYPVWSLFQSHETTNSSIHIVPTSVPESGIVSGVWYYYADDVGERIFYDQRGRFLEATANLENSDHLPMNVNTRAATFTMFQSKLSDDHFEVFNDVYKATLRDGDGDENNEPCTGGEFVEMRVSVSTQTGNANEIAVTAALNEINDLRNSYANQGNSWVTGGFDLLDATPYSELDQALNSYYTMNPFAENYDQIFQEYKDMRSQLSDLGVGNGEDGILFGSRGKGGAFNWYMETVLVWVWCWELYPDFDIGASNGTNGGGSNSSLYVPVYWEDIKELQDCFALNDVFDIDPNSGGNSNSTFTGNVDLCSKWNDYVETCLTDIQQTSATVYFSWEEYDSPYHYWGQFKEENPELFNEIINGDHGCVRTEDLDSFTEEPPVYEEECFQSSESVRLEYGIPLGLWKASGANSCCGDLDCIKEKIGSKEAGSEWPLFFLGENGVYHLWETCPETFDPVKVQNSYTTQVDDTMHSYLSDNITYGDYQIPAMCITHTRFWSTGGFMSKEDAREKLAFSFDKAREFTFLQFNADQSINLKERFRHYLTTMLKGQFGGQHTVNFVPCVGNINGNLNQFQVAWNGTCVHYYD